MFHLLRNCNLYAPAPLGIGDLLVANGRVARWGRFAGSMPEELACDELDLAGAAVTPALLDQHVHITGGGGEAGPGTRIPPLAPSSLSGAGVGTVVGVLGTDDTTRTTAELVAWTRELRAAGLTAFCHTGGYHLPPTTLTGSVRSDIAWIDVIIGVGETAISDHRSSQPQCDELLRVAADAHVAGLMTGKAGVLHLHVGDGTAGLTLVREALGRGDVPARVFNPTHVNRRRALFDEAVELARQGCTIDLTAFPVAAGEDAYSAGEALLLYLESGAPPQRVTVSSDGGGCLPCFDAEGRATTLAVASPAALLECLVDLLRADHEPHTVLPAFTANPADLLRLTRKGRIAAGTDADLLVFDDDWSLRHVMLGGRWHVRDGRQRITDRFMEPE